VLERGSLERGEAWKEGRRERMLQLFKKLKLMKQIETQYCGEKRIKNHPSDKEIGTKFSPTQDDKHSLL